MSMTNIAGTNNAWGSEYSLAAGAAYAAGSPQSSRGTIQLFLNVSAMAAGDTYTVKFYRKINGTAFAVSIPIAGAQGEPFVSLPLVMSEDWDISLICSAGTNTRAITWSIAIDTTADTTATITAAILAATVETGFSVARYLKIIGAAVAGARDSDGNFDSLAGTEEQIAGTAGDGTRSGITYGA